MKCRSMRRPATHSDGSQCGFSCCDHCYQVGPNDWTPDPKPLRATQLRSAAMLTRRPTLASSAIIPSRDDHPKLLMSGPSIATGYCAAQRKRLNLRQSQLKLVNLVTAGVLKQNSSGRAGI